MKKLKWTIKHAVGGGKCINTFKEIKKQTNLRYEKKSRQKKYLWKNEMQN